MNDANNTSVPLGPLLLKPLLVERVWGAKNLTPWFPGEISGPPVGEAWLTAMECAIASGPLQGQTLGAAVEHYPKLLAGAGGGFPLLLKVLFPHEKLSVQVHPNDAEAHALGFANGKTECWYVLSAEHGATVAVGFREPLTHEQMRAAIDNGTIERRMRHLPVKAGDMVFVDAGTVHAIGPGVVVLETQQYSDVTYRLFDYGRPRELHLEQGLAVARAETAAGVTAPVKQDTHIELLSCPLFTVDKFVLSGKPLVLECKAQTQILIALNDDCSLSSPAGVLSLPKAHAVVLPGEGVAYSLLGNGEVVRVR